MQVARELGFVAAHFSEEALGVFAADEHQLDTEGEAGGTVEVTPTRLASPVMLAWLRVPGWLMAIIGLAVAWPPAVVVLSDLGSAAGRASVALFVAGGVVYTLGAVGYALRRPNPHLAFGYHEVFHGLVLVGAACHYLTLALFVLPLDRS